MTLVALRRCPACGGVLEGIAGVAWMTCGDCPTAWDLFTEPHTRLATHHPAGEAGPAAARLPFFHFRDAGGGNAVWLPAYRAAVPGSSVATALTERGHAPDLVSAPLGSAVARGPAEALALFAALRSGAAPDPPLLVSLALRRTGDALVEPVTGLSLPAARLLPRPA